MTSLPPSPSPRREPTLVGLLGTLALLAGITVAVAAVCGLFGHVSLIGRDGVQWGIVGLRMFTIAAAAVVGAALGASGMALQGLLRNPLADPYILGISSGAGVGVLAGRVVFQTGLSTPALAAAGAVITCGAVYLIAHKGRRLDPFVLLLSGVIVNVFNGALILTMLLFAEKDKMLGYIKWSMGELPQWLWDAPQVLVVCACFVAGGVTLLLFRSAALNVMGLGDDVAAASGVSVRWLRVEVFIVAGGMTAAAVSLAGPVGFVGLIIPHLCRMALGPDQRKLVLYSAFVGAVFLMVTNTACMMLPSLWPWYDTGPIPVGVVTALTGGPFFIFLLRKRLRGSGR